MQQTRFDNMTFSALVEPGRQLSIVDGESHKDALVRKQFRSAFRSYWERFPHQRFPLLLERCPFCSGELLTCDHCTSSMVCPDEDRDEEPDSRGWLQYCRNCRYWR